MTERLPRLRPDQLTEDQADVYSAIAGGPRGAGPQLFDLKDASGCLNGPFGIMLHHPGLGMALQELGAAIRFHTKLNDRCREISILQVGVHQNSAFEWYAHEALGRVVGLTDDELGDLKVGRFLPTDPNEAGVVQFTNALLAETEIGQQDYDNFEQRLGREGLIELTVLVGYYRTLASLMRVFNVGAPTSD